MSVSLPAPSAGTNGALIQIDHLFKNYLLGEVEVHAVDVGALAAHDGRLKTNRRSIVRMRCSWYISVVRGIFRAAAASRCPS